MILTVSAYTVAVYIQSAEDYSLSG